MTTDGVMPANGLMVLIRRLEHDDAATYHEFRLRQLSATPQASTSTAEEEAERPLAWVEDRLRSPDRPHDFVLGAFAQNDRLVGTAGLSVSPQRQVRHKGTLFGVAVDAAAAGHGVGTMLVEHVVEEACLIDGMLQVVLTVSEGNDRAAALYARCGFEEFAREPRAVIVEGLPIAKVHMVRMLDGWEWRRKGK